jgi:hypothetical protein
MPINRIDATFAVAPKVAPAVLSAEGFRAAAESLLPPVCWKRMLRGHEWLARPEPVTRRGTVDGG